MRFRSNSASAPKIWKISFPPLVVVSIFSVKLLKPIFRVSSLAMMSIRSRAAINLGGGYHHASADHAGGFCVYADIPIAIKMLRRSGVSPQNSKILLIDLDAHQGNGNERAFRNDPSITIFDAYNSEIFPRDMEAEGRIDCQVKLKSGITDAEYLSVIQKNLLKCLERNSTFSLGIYIAGTDIAHGDPLGKMNVSESGVLARDLMVAKVFHILNVPWVMVTSGGYSKFSYKVIARSVAQLLCMSKPRPV
jgi:histone deacetylase 11